MSEDPGAPTDPLPLRRRHRSAEDRLAAHLDLQAVLARVAASIGPAQQLQPVLATILAGIRTTMRFSGGGVCLVDDGHLFLAAGDPWVSDDVAAVRVPVGAGLVGRVVATGVPVYSPDLDLDPRVDQALRRMGSNAGTVSYTHLTLPTICSV